MVGIVINYANTETIASQIEQDITDLCSHLPQPVSRNLAVAELLSAVFEILQQTDTGSTDDLLAEWRKYDCFKGKTAQLVSGDRLIKGKVEGIDGKGALLMRVNGQVQQFTSGDLSLRYQ